MLINNTYFNSKIELINMKNVYGEISKIYTLSKIYIDVSQTFQRTLKVSAMFL